MMPLVQIAGLFLTITAVLAFTTWAEAWLASAAPRVKMRRPDAQPPAARELALRAEDDVILVA